MAKYLRYVNYFLKCFALLFFSIYTIGMLVAAVVATFEIVTGKFDFNLEKNAYIIVVYMGLPLLLAIFIQIFFNYKKIKTNCISDFEIYDLPIKYLDDNQWKFLGGYSNLPTCIFIHHESQTIHFVNCHFLPLLWIYQDGIFPQKHYSCAIANLNWFRLTRGSLIIKTICGVASLPIDRWGDDNVSIGEFRDSLLSHHVKDRSVIIAFAELALNIANPLISCLGIAFGAGIISPAIGYRRIFNLEIGLFVGLLVGFLFSWMLILPLAYRLLYYYLIPGSSFANYLSATRIFLILLMAILGFCLGMMINLALLEPEGVGNLYLELVFCTIGLFFGLFVKIGR